MFPLADVLGFRVDADMYRVAIGITELVFGAILAVVPGTACVNVIVYQATRAMMVEAARPRQRL